MRLVWKNELGGLTFRARDCYIKWAPAGVRGLDLAAESARLQWAVAYTPVPRVLDGGADADGAWLVTTPLPGRNAIAKRWKAHPATAVTAIGASLRAFHDALPVEACPFSWSIEERVADVLAREGQAAAATVADAPPVDRLVVGHGDTCMPNTILTDDGRFSGHVDLGMLGVADRWSDIAVATMSTTWNYGPGWERPLLDAYGVEPDRDRTDYYRRLWNLGP